MEIGSARPHYEPLQVRPLAPGSALVKLSNNLIMNYDKSRGKVM